MRRLVVVVRRSKAGWTYQCALRTPRTQYMPTTRSTPRCRYTASLCADHLDVFQFERHLLAHGDPEQGLPRRVAALRQLYYETVGQRFGPGEKPVLKRSTLRGVVKRILHFAKNDVPSFEGLVRLERMCEGTWEYGKGGAKAATGAIEAHLKAVKLAAPEMKVQKSEKQVLTAKKFVFGAAPLTALLFALATNSGGALGPTTAYLRERCCVGTRPSRWRRRPMRKSRRRRPRHRQR